MILAQARGARSDGPDLFTLEWLRENGIPILVIVGFAVLVSFLAKLAVNRFQRRLEVAADATIEHNLQRTATVTQVLSKAILVVVWTLATLLVLDRFEVNLAPLLASAGIAGVALGFGAQSLVRDFLSGFFIIVEDQLAVGNVVDVFTVAGRITGKVEGVTLRVTTVRSFDGTLHVIPNGNIQLVGNKSRGWARAIVDVRLAAAEDVEAGKRAIEEVLDEVDAGNALEGVFGRPTVLGVETLGTYEVVIRVVAECRPSRRWDVERDLRARIKQRLDERGIATPFANLPYPMTGPAEEKR